MGVERQFTNERDRLIAVRVGHTSGGSRVKVEIEGPFSRSSNVITELEALHLRDALCEFLGRP